MKQITGKNPGQTVDSFLLMYISTIKTFCNALAISILIDWLRKGAKESMKHCGGLKEKGRKRAFINQKLEVKLGNMKQW